MGEKACGYKCYWPVSDGSLSASSNAHTKWEEKKKKFHAEVVYRLRTFWKVL